MTYYAVCYTKPRGAGFDVGEFDAFPEALAAAVEHGAISPGVDIIDAAEMRLSVEGQPEHFVWITRFD